MIVPRFWSEAVVHDKRNGKTVQVKRFGWSNESEADALAHAEQRAQEALERLRRGEKLPRREAKQVYGGGDGLPIREQIVDERDDVVITRNSYGARCLNTPDVLFVDIDFASANAKQRALFFLAGMIASVTILWALQFSTLAWFMVLLLMPFSLLLTFRQSSKKSDAEQTLPRLRALCQRWLDQDPRRRLRLYRTPAGVRAIAMHQTYDPSSDAVRECFNALSADPVYQKMCFLQRCFRARVSGKPWRMGFELRFRPRPGIWPLSPALRQIREQWVAQYEQEATRFAACQFLEELGTGPTDAKVARVVAWHDDLCGALSSRPLA